MQQNRLAAGFLPEPLGELTGLPRPPAGCKGPLRGGRAGVERLVGKEGWEGKDKWKGRKEREACQSSPPRTLNSLSVEESRINTASHPYANIPLIKLDWSLK